MQDPPANETSTQEETGKRKKVSLDHRRGRQKTDLAPDPPLCEGRRHSLPFLSEAQVPGERAGVGVGVEPLAGCACDADAVPIRVISIRESESSAGGAVLALALGLALGIAGSGALCRVGVRTEKGE